MLTRFMKALAARAADDARALQRRYLPADAVAQAAETSVRALTRHWPAAHALAEVAAARHARSVPSPAAPGAPLRVLLAARMGAIGPAEEIAALHLLSALERLGAEARERPIEIAVCGTEALAGTTVSPLAARLFGHRVLDATQISAADVAAWVASSDIVVTCNDFSSDVTGQADVELAALALGFARARGLPSLAFGVVSAAERFHPEALAFLKRFASKAHFFAPTAEVAASLEAAGLRAEGVAEAAPPEPIPAGAEVVVLDGPPPSGALGLGTSILGEAFTLGALLLGRPHPRSQPGDTPATRKDAAAIASALEAAGHDVRHIHLGPNAPPESEAIDSGEAFSRLLRELPAGTPFVCLAPAALPALLANGHAPVGPTLPLARLPHTAPASPAVWLRRIVDAAAPAAAHLALPAPARSTSPPDGDEVNP